MPHQEIAIPTLVQHLPVDERRHFQLSPLFLHQPSVLHRRYQEGLNRYRREIKRWGASIKLNWEEARDLFWLAFQPPVTLEHVPLQFQLDHHQVDGIFTAVFFEVQQLQWVMLPGFNKAVEWWQPGSGAVNQLETLIKKHLRQQIAARPRQWSPTGHYGFTRDHIVNIPLRLDFELAPNRFQPDRNRSFFFRQNEDESFDGLTELNKMAIDLNQRFPEALSRAYLRESPVGQLSELLFRPTSHAPLALIGPSGVGRRTLLYEALYRYLAAQPEQGPPPAQVWLLDPTRIVAGMAVVGRWQQRLEAVIQYLITPAPHQKIGHKLIIDNPLALLRAGQSSQNSLNARDVIKPYLEKRQLQLVLIATPEEWMLLQEADRNFSELFQGFPVEEPPLVDAAKMILAQRKTLEISHSTRFELSAIQQLLYFHRVYTSERALPGAVVVPMQQLANRYRYQTISAQEVRAAFERTLGLREALIDPYSTFEPEEVYHSLSQELIGQPEAARALAQVVNLYKSQLHHPGRPISTLLFLGPTGVGKTHAAKVLARYLTGDEGALVRFDLNEYLDAGAVDRLIGDDYQPEGQLTGRIRYQPFAVLLLDEIEKAHPKVHDLLLQLLDDGRLTDRQGRTVNFTQTIIIMTSNAGTHAQDNPVRPFNARTGEQDRFRRALQRYFRPEFLNRIDQMVVFSPLTREHSLAIAQLQIQELLQREGFVRRSAILNVSAAALSYVADRGFDPQMGGRALKRQIERDLTILAAEQLLQLRLDSPILFNIDLDNQQLTLQLLALPLATTQTRSPLPTLPPWGEGKDFFEELNQTVLAMLQLLRETPPGSAINGYEDWWYHDLVARLDQLREDLEIMVAAATSPTFNRDLPRPLRSQLVSSNVAQLPKTAEANESAAQLYREVLQRFRYAQACFNPFSTEMTLHLLRVRLAQLATLHYQANQRDILVIQLTCLLEGQGNDELIYLLDLYRQLLDELGYAIELEEKTHHLRVEGYGAGALLQGEVGIHLFVTSNRSPVPVRFHLEPPVAPRPHQPDEIIRLYQRPHSVADLRSGLVHPFELRSEELLLLLLAPL